MKCSLVVFVTTGSAFFLFATFSISSFAQRMPNHTLTPGHATYHTTETVCAAGSASDERMVPESEKNAVHQRYGIAKCQGYCSGPQGCEIDHLISLELGGANTSDNLWPQPYDGNWNAHDKDRLEARLHKPTELQEHISKTYRGMRRATVIFACSWPLILWLYGLFVFNIELQGL